jgi:D-alanine-D-alanine ligase
MRVAFLYNRSSEDPANAADDEVPSRSPVVGALKRLGHRVTPIACSLNLARIRRRIQRIKPDVVFNRVESLGGSDAMMAAITLLLDTMQIPYTGNSTAALVATASKLAVKERLVRAGLPTPAWTDLTRTAGETKDAPSVPRTPYTEPCTIESTNSQRRFILKSVLEHASFQMDDESIVATQDREQIMRLLRDREENTGRAHFAEEFIDGREFNLSLIGEPPQVLPPAEIDFSAFPRDKPRIVGHGAKWDATSFEFHNTPRRFEFPAADGPLLRRLSELALKCWQLFELRGYARVDFRCDAAGRPWILEINTNPCLSPESGFAAALQQGEISFAQGIQRILEVAVADRSFAEPPFLPTEALNA